jgi:hypothetical protein
LLAPLSHLLSYQVAAGFQSVADGCSLLFVDDDVTGTDRTRRKDHRITTDGMAAVGLAVAVATLTFVGSERRVVQTHLQPAAEVGRAFA